jgi:hypothetical protein
LALGPWCRQPLLRRLKKFTNDRLQIAFRGDGREVTHPAVNRGAICWHSRREQYVPFVHSSASGCTFQCE